MSAPGNTFGPLLDGSDVERALLAFLRRWMPTYVPAVFRAKEGAQQARNEPPLWAKGLEAIAPIRSFTVVHRANEKWPEDQLPMLLAHSPAESEAPHHEGDGDMSGAFLVNLTAIAYGANMADTKELARLYATAASAAMLQHPGLDGFADELRLGILQNYPVTAGVEKERNLMAVTRPVFISVEAMLNALAGPAEPLEQPATDPGDVPRVASTSLEVDVEDLFAPGGLFD